MRHLIPLLVLASPSVMWCQPVPSRAARFADSSVAATVRQIRSDGPRSDLSWVTHLLRQRATPQAGGKLDELADSLSAAAINGSHRRPGSAESIDPIEAFSAVTMAGRIGTYDGTPYQGALDRLILMHREGAGSLRSAALRGMLSVAGGRDRALAYLRSIAVSDDQTAQYAVGALIDEAERGSDSQNSEAMRNEAKGVLRQFFDSGTVKEEFAVFALQTYAARQGWRRVPA